MVSKLSALESFKPEFQPFSNSLLIVWKVFAYSFLYISGVGADEHNLILFFDRSWILLYIFSTLDFDIPQTFQDSPKSDLLQIFSCLSGFKTSQHNLGHFTAERGSPFSSLIFDPKFSPEIFTPSLWVFSICRKRNLLIHFLCISWLEKNLEYPHFITINIFSLDFGFPQVFSNRLKSICLLISNNNPGWKQVSITWFNYFDRVEFHPLFPTLDFDFPLSLPRNLTSACLLIFMFLRVQNKSAEPHLITLAGLDFTPSISPLDYVPF